MTAVFVNRDDVGDAVLVEVGHLQAVGSTQPDPAGKIFIVNTVFFP
jgi:hypothetical protein